MDKHRGARAVADAGGATGLATVVLAMLSASALAAFGLVGASQLAPPESPRPTGAQARPLAPPVSVHVTPRPAETPGGGSDPGAPGSPKSQSPEPTTSAPSPPAVAGPTSVVLATGFDAFDLFPGSGPTFGSPLPPGLTGSVIGSGPPGDKAGQHGPKVKEPKKGKHEKKKPKKPKHEKKAKVERLQKHHKVAVPSMADPPSVSGSAGTGRKAAGAKGKPHRHTSHQHKVDKHQSHPKGPGKKRR
jgi:hypothetical protein